MSIVKRQLEEREAEEAWARGYLVKHGFLEECEVHDGELFDAGIGGHEEIEAQADADLAAGKIKLRPGQTRDELMDLLKSTYDDNAADECAYCAKNMEG